MDSTVSMKTILYHALVLATMVAWQTFAEDLKTADWGIETNGIQVSISLANNATEVTNSEPVKILVRYRNTSTNKAISIYNLAAFSRDSSYSFSLISPSGKDVSPKPLEVMAGSGAFFPVPPSQTREFAVDLNEIYRFRENGTYKVILKKKIMSFENSEWFTVISNPLLLSVVPGEPKKEENRTNNPPSHKK